MIVLGVHRGHDAGACLIEDGRILCVVEAERVRKIKHMDGPGAIPESLRAAICDTGVEPNRIERIVIADSYRDDIEKHHKHLVELMHGDRLLAPLGSVGALLHIERNSSSDKKSR